MLTGWLRYAWRYDRDRNSDFPRYLGPRYFETGLRYDGIRTTRNGKVYLMRRTQNKKSSCVSQKSEMVQNGRIQPISLQEWRKPLTFYFWKADVDFQKCFSLLLLLLRVDFQECLRRSHLLLLFIQTKSGTFEIFKSAVFRCKVKSAELLLI